MSKFIDLTGQKFNRLTVISINKKDKWGTFGNYEPENCRFVSHRENSHNTRKQKNRELPTGIYKIKNKFIAQIYINNKIIHIGTFSNIEKVKIAYNNYLYP